MKTSNKSAIIPRLILVMGLSFVVATFATQSVVEDPTILKVMQIDQKLEHTSLRVTENSEQIQHILASKYKLEPTDTK